MIFSSRRTSGGQRNVIRVDVVLSSRKRDEDRGGSGDGSKGTHFERFERCLGDELRCEGFSASRTDQQQ